MPRPACQDDSELLRHVTPETQHIRSPQIRSAHLSSSRERSGVICSHALYGGSSQGRKHAWHLSAHLPLHEWHGEDGAGNRLHLVLEDAVVIARGHKAILGLEVDERVHGAGDALKVQLLVPTLSDSKAHICAQLELPAQEACLVEDNPPAIALNT
eukprot:CAMPEP_0185167126 /NCGR_PEP_ID=MMETSP1139-20130426/13753_1 /TAXON_ID=298111 /ORGANISM="Pavlova sp., Strain CCMP459" /LENGTH=155 /DNA_ID=CAMNT_0027732597 /DNA_START=44 /DNA_END=511 /DNA_ORIENTATION=-